MTRAEIASTEDRPMQKITTFLWFNTEAEEAAKFDLSINLPEAL